MRALASLDPTPYKPISNRPGPYCLNTEEQFERTRRALAPAANLRFDFFGLRLRWGDESLWPRLCIGL